jgi:DNA polymerase-3 subunit delta'
MAFSVEQASGYLREATTHGRLAHTFLFTGPDGSGKRRLVAEFFRIANGETATAIDLHVIEPESKSRRILVEQIRNLEGALRMRASRARFKFGVVYEADRLMPQAANAFLKTLEEPPDHSILILVTALPEVLLDTIRSRCIEVTLFRGGKKDLTPDESVALEELFKLIFANGFSVVTALKYTRLILGLLANLRERIETEHGELLAKDQSAFKQTTDGVWLAEREVRLTALTESRYVKARADLIMKLVEAFGDALRIKFESRHLDIEEHRFSAARLAERISSDELLERTGALQSLMDSLARNVQEALAIEVAFMKAVGPAAQNLARVSTPAQFELNKADAITDKGQ